MAIPFLLFAFRLLSHVSAECLPEPLSLPLKTIGVNQGGWMRGVEAYVGSPKQSFAFLPRLDYNNTYIYTQEFANDTGCKDTSDAWCASHHGGFYYTAEDSNTPKTFGSATQAGGTEAEASTNASFSNWITENMAITSNPTLSEFPIGIPRVPLGDPNYYPQAVFGLDSGSTLLNALKNGGHIGARVWSMFWGLAGATASTKMEGSLILGGFDAAKVSGPPYNYSIGTSSESGCDYMVIIEDILLDFPNGTTSSLFDGVKSQLMQACIDPSYPTLMTLPYEPYFANFETMSGIQCTERSLGVNYFNILCPTTSLLYPGALTIKLQSGLSVQIPNDQLLVPNLSLAPDGSLVEDALEKTLIINSIQDVNSKDMPYLGRQFLSAAYLMTNLEAESSTLWAARPTADERVVPVNAGGETVDAICALPRDADATTNTTTPSSAATPVLSSAHPAEPASGLSTAGIAGVVVGVVAVVATISATAFFCARRRRRAAREAAPPPAYEPDEFGLRKPPTPQAVELAGAREPQELWGGEVIAVTRDGRVRGRGSEEGVK